MTLYLGSKKVNINLGGTRYKLNLYINPNTPIVNSRNLLTSDGYILKDSNGATIIPKDNKYFL